MRLFGKKPKPAKARLSLPRWMLARFDAAQTTKDNARHWSAAEFLSADAEADSNVRKILRTRARYEVQNNSYARGIVKTLADDTVGTGPRLQMLLEDEAKNRLVEHDFAEWAKRIRLAAKLRTIRMARCQDGEAFAVLAQNPRLSTNVTLDIQLIEADRVTDDEMNADGRSVDGITFDSFGNPVSYNVLKAHPGGTASFGTDSVTVKAENMIHVFRQDRPEQHRGIPEITSALPLFAHLRRFTLAVVSAAEAAADFAGVLYTDAPANGEADAVEAMDTIQLERNMLLTMPGGWKMSQVDPKQPVTTYGEFKHEILNEISRCLNIPYNIAAGNSSGYNYASGRLDHQTYYKSLKVDRAFIEEAVLDRILERWLREWTLANRTTLDVCDCRHTWFWDGHEHVDPSKEARAQEKRLKNHTTTLASEYAKQGKDWESELRQRAKEKELMDELGLTVEETAPSEQGKEDDED
ncbi:MAG: phage portal protein [Kiritimatiellae bacterium]|nr:phage portal protein [Kiritimatiellia bacterium]